MKRVLDPGDWLPDVYSAIQNEMNGMCEISYRKSIEACESVDNI
jgi:hypothetical protein